MLRKSLLSIFFAGVVVLIGGLSASAQVVTGTVEMLKADGTRTPVAGATVDAFRMDIKSSSPPSKTDKNGQFLFAGLQVGWSFILSVSGPNIAPNFLANVKPGQEKLLITVVGGDGKRWSGDEAKKAFAAQTTTGGGTNPSNEAAIKKAQAEYDAQVKDVNTKNEKANRSNEVTARAIKEGKEAMDALNYDVAIAKYEEGYTADPNFVGSAPIFLLNKGVALTARAVATHNSTIKAATSEEKLAGAAKVKKDLADAADGYVRAWTILKNAAAGDIADKANYDATKLNILRGANDAFRRSVDTERIDPIVIEAAKQLAPEYAAVETDAAKKMKATLVIGDLYRLSGDPENAAIAYKKILETSPDNPDALAGAGLVLVDLGWAKEDKEKSQEGANLLQKFVSIAPNDHKYKEGAAEYLKILKTQNVTPDKPASTKKKP